MFRQIIALLLLVAGAPDIHAQTLAVATIDGNEHEVDYDGRRTVKKWGIVLNTGELAEYEVISAIRTEDFDAYELVALRTAPKRNEHVELEFTGDANLYALRLDRLRQKRDRARSAQGAGGILMLLGALSGNEELTRVGAATYVVSRAVGDQRAEDALDTQTEAIIELQEQRRAAAQANDDTDGLEADLRRLYGDENVEGLIALIDGNDARALALAGVAEVSDDANHRFGAAWLRAIVYADQDQRAALESEYDRLIVLDPEVDSYEDADEWMQLLLEDLADLRAVQD